VAADPVPDDAIFLHDCQGAVVEADASRVDVIFAFEFLEVQARVRGISLEKPIRSFGFPSDAGGQVGEKMPEPPSGP
jgi:hypothetical protein